MGYTSLALSHVTSATKSYPVCTSAMARKPSRMKGYSSGLSADSITDSTKAPIVAVKTNRQISRLCKMT